MTAERVIVSISRDLGPKLNAIFIIMLHLHVSTVAHSRQTEHSSREDVFFMGHHRRGWDEVRSGAGDATESCTLDL